jgi:RHS repeat-associated protein
MSNANAYPVWEATYLPYGQERAVAGGSSTSPNHYKFTGKERDPESGLDYFGARYYASALGRFLSPDEGPLREEDPQSLNRLAYVRNNPTRYVDEHGNYWVEPTTIAGRTFYKAVRETSKMATVVGAFGPWGKYIDQVSRRDRADTNKPNMLGNVKFMADKHIGIEDPETYFLTEALDLDRDVFAAFAKEHGLVEQSNMNDTLSSMTFRDRQQAAEFGEFHTAYRYGQEIKRLEGKLEKTKDEKKREKIEKDIEKRKNSKQFKKHGKTVQKYIDQEAK